MTEQTKRRKAQQVLVYGSKKSVPLDRVSTLFDKVVGKDQQLFAVGRYYFGLFVAQIESSSSYIVSKA